MTAGALTAERIAELRALCEAATPLPWTAFDGVTCWRVVSETERFEFDGQPCRQHIAVTCKNYGETTAETRDDREEANAKLIASVSALPAALDAIEALTKRVGDLRDCRTVLQERDQRREQLLRRCLEAIESLDEGTLGYAEGQQVANCREEWPIRDELAARIRAELRALCEAATPEVMNDVP